MTNLKRKEERLTAKLNSLRTARIVPVFYAADTNYLPFLSVSLLSLKINADRNFNYRIYVLHTDITSAEQEPLLALAEDGFSIEFVCVKNELEKIRTRLQLRDYYTGATYYRIFIADMFPQYDKALYLDGDTVITGDISRLYAYDLKDNLVGAIPDRVVKSHPVFRSYTQQVLDIEPDKYFNAGILVMNLKAWRDCDFYSRFLALLTEYKFRVAQDQDYLNVLCHGRVKYLPYSWNTMPIGKTKKRLPKLIHYNLTAKPWHYAHIPYAEVFWQYVRLSSYADIIRISFASHTTDKIEKDMRTEEGLIALASEEIAREDNFIKARRRAADLESSPVFSAEVCL